MIEQEERLPDAFNQTLIYLLLLSYKGFNMAKKLTLKEWIEKEEDHSPSNTAISLILNSCPVTMVHSHAPHTGHFLLFLRYS